MATALDGCKGKAIVIYKGTHQIAWVNIFNSHGDVDIELAIKNATLIVTVTEMYGVLTRIVEMHKRNLGHGLDTLIELFDLVEEAEQVLKEARGEG